MHIDADAFFASVEQGFNPLLRNRPVIVGGSADQRGVVHTASYESEFAGLQDLCHSLDMPRRRGLTKQWRDFENFLVDEHQQGRNVCIILDDAQLMHQDALRIIHHIYNFDRGGRKLAQVVLFGQPELSYIFALHPEIRSRVGSWFRLNPLSLEDTLNLIRFRCRVAGREGSLFTQGAFLEIFEATNGVPREIVSVCALVIEELGKRSELTADVEATHSAIEIQRSFRSQPLSFQAALPIQEPTEED